MIMCTSCVSQPEFPILHNTELLGGIAPAIYRDLSQRTSIVVLEKCTEISNIAGIAFVGSSASGKTTIVNSVRGYAQVGDEVVIPRRYITRPPRRGDDMTENLHIQRADLYQKIQTGEVTVSWVRHMEGKREELYGFEATDKKKLAIYSANNDLCRRAGGVGRNILVVGVYAPDDVRERRLLSRSPDMSRGETAYRLGDSSKNIVPFAHILIKNYGETETAALADVQALVQSVVRHRVRWGEIRNIGTPVAEYRSRLFVIENYDVLFSDGVIKNFQRVERSPGVRTMITCGEEILVTREWREEIGGWDYRLPGGKMFETIASYKQFLQEHGETLLPTRAQETAAREVQEETGITLFPSDLSMAQLSKCGSVISWDLYYFQVEIQKQDVAPSVTSSESEIVENVWVSRDDALKLCLQGVVSEDRTSSFLLKFLYRQQQSR